ncbi:macoilin-like isoform X2 [Paramacrobiotus metropolitanus]|uniref:macoilin-like isoform X2 n=1 Tax=Paramacrobiotus metropolitanus TaxID=2943436 RepID=UPI00244648EE|nr:macoilin-like isoform X2 [Paramacrobiotus metropolitanus]
MIRSRGRGSNIKKNWNKRANAIFLAIKLLLIWMVIVALDFAAGFRLEYFWPVWLMLQSVADAYKYQGIGFTVFFISMVITSDILVYMFVPTACMFFLASLYVWIQLMMLSGIERGICVQTIVIWMVFLYIEATMRLRELKSDPSIPFHWDICRPFAAHCVGYPLVTFSFSVKSFIGFKYRKHKQLQIATENKLFRDLINEALPEESRRPLPEALSPLESKGPGGSKNVDSAQANGFIPVENGGTSSLLSAVVSSVTSSSSNPHSESRSQKRKNNNNNSNGRLFGDVLVSIAQKALDVDNMSSASSSTSSSADADLANEPGDLFARLGGSPGNNKKQSSVMELDNCDGDSVESEKAFKLSNPHRHAKHLRSTSPSLMKVTSLQNFEKESVSGSSSTGRKQKVSVSTRDTTVELSAKSDDVYLSKLENDVKRLRSDLQISRQLEQELRSQISTLQSGDKSARTDLTKVQQENESLQQRLSNLIAARQQDKQNAALFEKKLGDERKSRLQLETQLNQERKQRKAIEDAGNECSESCKNQRKEIEAELRQLRRDLTTKDEKLRSLNDEVAALKQNKESYKDSDVQLTTALSQLQDRNAHLENSLGAETKLKLDLFSALGEAKRQVEISQNVMCQKDKEIADLKQKIARIAEAMTLLPPTAGNQTTISAFVAEALKHQTPTHSRLQDKPHVGFN